MKFSYKLIKKYLPGLKSKRELIHALNMHAFETKDGGGNIIEVSVPPNRYSDIASHAGIIKEAAAVLGLRSKYKDVQSPKKILHGGKILKIVVQDKRLCPRYTAEYFENIKLKPSPNWMQEVLEECGLRPINNVVDIMNYAMLEVGQPLHAFDYDKLEGGKLIIRKARKDERITSIEGMTYTLNPGMLVIADKRGPVAIAGIKGGKRTEVTEKTKKIIVESANFDSVSIYKTSRMLNLSTDASLRFAHNFSKKLAPIGLTRAGDLLQEIVKAKSGGAFDSMPKKLVRRVITFNVDKYNSFIGASISEKEAKLSLERLGFTFKGAKLEVPALRDDIETEEDIFEEVARLEGLDSLKSQPPIVSLRSTEFDELVEFNSKVRDMFAGFGFDEVYNTSFVSRGGPRALEIENPISEDKKYLRESLKPLLSDNVDENLKFFTDVRIFEIGKIFLAGRNVQEKYVLGIASGSKSHNMFFELKGVVDQLFQKLGLTDFFMVGTDEPHMLRIESDHTVLGYLHNHNNKSLAEIELEKLLELVRGELTFLPLPKYPAVGRDISILVEADVRIGEVIQEMQLSNVRLIEDVDLIDEYFGEEGKRQSITLRIVFRSEDRTLSAKDVDKEMKKITNVLQKKFGAQVR